MKHPEYSFDWSQTRAVLATAEEGSLSAAARALGLTQPTLGRQVSALEESLGLALFERVGRGLVLTHSGQAVVAELRAMGAAAARVSLVAAGQTETVAGTVSISVSDVVATLVMPDLLVKLAARAPEIVIELVVTNSLSDLMRREADIAVRHVAPEAPDLIARRIRGGEAGLWATPDFLRRHGRPATMEETRGLPYVGMAPPAEMMTYLTAWGLPAVEADVRVYSDNMMASVEMVRRGLGLGVLTDEIAGYVGGLERVLPDFSPMQADIWLTTHRELRTSRRIRVVFDFLAENLRA